MDVKVNDKVTPKRGRNKGRVGEVRSIYADGKVYVRFGRNDWSCYLSKSLEVVRDGEKECSKERSGNS